MAASSPLRLFLDSRIAWDAPGVYEARNAWIARAIELLGSDVAADNDILVAATADQAKLPPSPTSALLVIAAAQCSKRFQSELAAAAPQDAVYTFTLLKHCDALTPQFISGWDSRKRATNGQTTPPMFPSVAHFIMHISVLFGSTQ